MAGTAPQRSTLRRDITVAILAAVAGGLISSFVTLLVAYKSGYIALDNKITQAREKDEHRVEPLSRTLDEKLGRVTRTTATLCENLTNRLEREFELRCKQGKGMYDLSGHVCTREDGTAERLPYVCPPEFYRLP